MPTAAMQKRDNSTIGSKQRITLSAAFSDIIEHMSISVDNIVLTDEQKRYLATLAKQTGKPWDEVLKEALSSFRARVEAASGQDESFYDAATRLGLIGCVKGGPPDLSTNPKYMEGFGEHAS